MEYNAISYRLISYVANSKKGYRRSSALSDEDFLVLIIYAIAYIEECELNHDNCTADDDTAWAKVVAKYQAGEWVTFTYQAIERYTGVLTFECGGETATLSKSGNTLAVAGQYMGIMFGYVSSVEVANIQIVATDSDGAYENLVWPAEEGALVQNVSADAIGDASSVTTTTEATTTAATTTEAPADETDAPADETTAAEEEKKKGCKSSVALSALAISAIASSAIVLRAKKKED